MMLTPPGRARVPCPLGEPGWVWMTIWSVKSRVAPPGAGQIVTGPFCASRLSDLGIAKDIVIVQASDVERYGRNPYLIIYSALTEGKEL